MIGETVRFQAPYKVLMATSPPIDPAEQLLPRSFRSALSQLRSGHCSIPTVTLLAGPMTPPATITTPPTTRWPTSLAVPLIWPEGICGRHLSRSPSSWQGSHSSAICPHCRSISIRFFHNLHSCFLTGLQRDHIILISPVVRGSSPPPLANNNHQSQQPFTFVLFWKCPHGCHPLPGRCFF